MRRIDVETLRFLEMLEELSALTENGILPFEAATEDNWGMCAFYDSSTKDEEGYYEVVSMALVDPEHHDIISYCNQSRYANNYKINVFINENDEEQEPYIIIHFDDSEEWIIIENGEWYFVD